MSNNISNKKSAASLKKKKSQVKKVVKSLEDWIQEGEDLSEQFEFGKAYNCFEQALKIDPNNAAIIDTLGEVSLEMGQFDQAINHFKNSIKMAPNNSASKYMNLGQLVGGEEALKFYTKGIQIMEIELTQLLKTNKNNNSNGNNNNKNKSPFSNMNNNIDEEEEEEEEMDPIEDLKLHICSGLCSIAELYLTDQCFDDNAEVECEKHLLRAIEVSPLSPEPYSLMSSMKISQVKNNEAVEYLIKSYSLWEHSSEEERPDFEYRFNVSLLFIELGNYRTAIDILEQLVEEQDNVSEIWYSLGQAYYHLNEPLSAQDCIASAKELLKIAFDGRDESLEKQILELDAKIESAVKLLPPDVIKKYLEDEEVKKENEDDSDEEMI